MNIKSINWSMQFLVAGLALFASCGGDENIAPQGGSENPFTVDVNLQNAYVYGVYEKGVALTEENYIELNVHTYVPGEYNITTKNENGYTFSASGVFESLGVYQIILTGEGTPKTDQIDSIYIASESDDIKIGVPVLSGLSESVILACGQEPYDDLYYTIAMSGRGEYLWSKPGISNAGAVDNDVFYVAGKEALMAVDVKTGSVKWESELLANMAWLTYADEVVYVGSSTSDYYALDASNGEILWQYETESTSRPVGTPVVGEDLVFLMVGESTHALQKSDGAFVWKAVDANSYSTPVLSGDRLYLSSNSVSAIDISDGSTVWSVPVGSNLALSLNNGLLYMNGYNKTYCLDATDGSEVWSLEMEYLGKSPLVVDDVVIVYSSYQFSSIYGLDAMSGEVLWKEGASSASAAELVSQGGLLFEGGDFSVNVYHLDAGQIIHRYGEVGSPLLMEYLSVFAVYNSATNEVAYPPTLARL